MTQPQTEPSSVPRIDAPTLKRWLHDGAEIGLLDVREHGQYGEGHPFLAVSLPYSRLEVEAPRLLPRRGARLVAFDAGDGVALRAAAALRGLGYTDVHVLEGGAPAWRQAGYTLFAGVNLPSKTFGELAEHICHTPRIGAAELASRQREGDKLVVLDGRPYTEYQKMNIPGGICCPNGELALRIQELVPDPATTIVINCAGRTRSIIGAQTLINLGVPNPVLALENGTQGWYLADLPLEHGSRRKYPDTVPVDALPALRDRAAALAREHGVRTVDAAQARAWLADPARTTYLCDVRTEEEYAAGTLAGAQHTPGGQLIQATDQYIGVRNARLVLIDSEGVRAPVVASWLRQMGWEACVLHEGVAADVAAPFMAADLPALPHIAAAELPGALRDGAVLVDVRPGMAYRKGHIAGARWSIRPRLARLGLPAGARVVLLATDAAVAALAARELAALGITQVRLNMETSDAWRAAGLAIEAGDDVPADEDCIDYLFFVHDRHDGNKAAARQYLAWETNLIHQIDEQERSIFRFPVHRQAG
ncbi:rhodanese-like domain-containing protein [Bordetella bronchialis]|uniref:Sulfurtransferase n=1 Tax=Bordetella bronchialis TaxID=463025 RepID=A0A193FVV5_9BORD|nr:rhodanese-like domain-containing protein [Bordetella bronchialis]ANN66078.1 sulfurtransferase [Bordetella bronchialis]ANN71164.1 sulfurtransferase [Bordetella bronchialis]